MSNFRLIDRETGAQSVGDPSDMARKSVAAMQHDYGRILLWAVCSGTEDQGETLIGSRQIAAEVRWRVSREVGKLDQGTGRGGASPEQ